MENKEAIKKLTDYFLEQDPGDIARILANMMIDLNRLKHLDLLPKNEADCLLMRFEKNLEELNLFLKMGSKDKINIFNFGE
jgi:hypothetical protein